VPLRLDFVDSKSILIFKKKKFSVRIEDTEIKKTSAAQEQPRTDAREDPANPGDERLPSRSPSPANDMRHTLQGGEGVYNGRCINNYIQLKNFVDIFLKSV
jgi:hypothetical protein